MTVQFLTHDEITEIIKCATDPIYWAEKYIKIIDAEKGITNITLYSWQKDVLNNTNNVTRKHLITTARQVGGTTIGLIALLHYSIFNHSKCNAAIGIKMDNAYAYRDIIHVMYDNLPTFMKPELIVDNKGMMQFSNDSRISFTNCNSSSLRGKAYSFVFMDQLAYSSNWKEFYHGVLPVLSSGRSTKILLISTHNPANEDYTKFVEDVTKHKTENGWYVKKVAWYNMIKDRPSYLLHIGNIRISLTKEQFDREYECV